MVVFLVDFPIVVPFPTFDFAVIELQETVLEPRIQIAALLVFATVLALGVEAVHRELACLLAEASEFILLYSKLRGVDHDLVQIEPLQVFIVVSEKVGDNFLLVCILFSADDANVLDLTSRALERGMV